MPRLNVDDSLFSSDPWFRLIATVGDHEKALGKLVLFWLLGQKHWRAGEQIIPEDKLPEAFRAAVDSGFGESREGGVYVKGSRDQFAWLSQRIEAGRKGGLATAKRPLAGAEQTQASSSSSSSEEKNIRVSAPLRLDFERFWQSYPKRNGRKNGKKPALAAWNKLKPEDQSAALQAIPRQIAHKKACDERKAFCPEFPDAVRWLRNRRFEDEIAGSDVTPVTCHQCRNPVRGGFINTDKGPICFECRANQKEVRA